MNSLKNNNLIYNKNMKLELRIFICFIITIICVMYSNHSYSNSEEKATITQQTVGGFEIRIQNDYDNERLETTQTLDEALTYLKRYSVYHEDLFVYDLVTGMQVASSNSGTGVVYKDAN